MRRSTILKGARLVLVGAFLYFVVEPWLVFLPPNGKTVPRVDPERSVALTEAPEPGGAPRASCVPPRGAVS